jgi:hypothetical protein
MKSSQYPLIHTSPSSSIYDDASTSSTVSVSNVSKPHQSLPASSTKSGRKLVHFNESANVFHENVQTCQEHLCDLWYSAEDRRYFKEDYVHCVQDILRVEVKNNKGHRSYLSVMHHVYESCCEVNSENETEHITKSDEKLFNRWVKVTESRHGLEKASNRVLAQDQSCRRVELVATVLCLQEDWSYHLHNDGVYAEIIRGACENISRPSRLFTKRLACLRTQGVP